MAGEVTATAAAAAATAGDRSVPARVLGSRLRELRRKLVASASTAAGVCVASAAVAVLAAGDLEEGKCPKLVVLAICVAFHAGIWLLVHGVSGAESK